MTGRKRREQLIGYLLVTAAATTLYVLFHHQLGALLPTEPVTGEPSIRQLPGILAFVLLFGLTVFFSAPTNPLFFVAAGFLYGAPAGTAIAVLAVTVGSVAAFVFFRSTIANPKAETLHNIEPARMLLMLTLLRCSPWFPSPLINVFCAVIRVRPLLFAASTLLGTVPLVSVYTLTASRLHGPLDLTLLRSPEIRVALFIMGALSLVGLLKPLRVVAGLLGTVVVPLPHRADNA